MPVRFVFATITAAYASLLLNRALFKIFGALTKDTYKDIICKYFGMLPTDEQISAR